MTNTAIISDKDYPTKVIVEIHSGNVDNTVVMQEGSTIKIYSIPTSGWLIIDQGGLKNDNCRIYSTTGQIVMQWRLQGKITTLNVSTLTNEM